MLIKLQRDNYDYIFYDYENKKLVIDLKEFDHITSIEISIIVIMLKNSDSVKLINYTPYIIKVLEKTNILNHSNLQLGETNGLE